MTDQFRFGEDYHNGHEFDLPRLSTSACRGCGDTWSKIVSHTRWCGAAEPMPARSNLIPAPVAGVVIPAMAAQIGSVPIARRSFWGWMARNGEGRSAPN